ncbi:uncharacterized protein LOC125878908 [Epinephelus fuscoguttatus]|uniref:uncharacterized protein LOC125878908 n=1 Tax=Epinephelus fuscoguttatus TaxID=293821 RepID=UPI0020D09F59|nr:uncharacterized protein LOC125878908 [Epinephelus fuscoguttatus]
MVKMSGRVTSCCVALFFALTSVTAVEKLNSINDLKKINFGKAVPKHSLLLLHWFANTVDINNNNIIQLTFDLNRGDYGSHHYGNFEGLLDPLPRGNGYRYYTIGNLNQETSMPLPSYVVHPQREYMGRNRDRIIIRVREQNTGWGALPRIDQVYITQHYDTSENQGTPYDPAHTYQITTDLLRQIRDFSAGQNQQQLLHLRNRYGSNADDFLLRDIRITWGDLACLGLLLFIVIQEKHSFNQRNNRPENNSRPVNYPRHENRRNDWVDGASERWTNIPRDFRGQSDVVVDFNNDEDHDASSMTWSRESGSEYISLPRCNIRRLFCILCIAALGLILLGIALFFSLRDNKTLF